MYFCIFTVLLFGVPEGLPLCLQLPAKTWRTNGPSTFGKWAQRDWHCHLAGDMVTRPEKGVSAICEVKLKIILTTEDFHIFPLKTKIKKWKLTFLRVFLKYLCNERRIINEHLFTKAVKLILKSKNPLFQTCIYSSWIYPLMILIRVALALETTTISTRWLLCHQSQSFC